MNKVNNGTFETFYIDDSYEHKETDLAIRTVDSQGQILWYWKHNDTLEPALSRPAELERLYKIMCLDCPFEIYVKPADIEVENEQS